MKTPTEVLADSYKKNRNLILAGNDIQAREYAHRQGWKPTDYRIVNCPDQVRGFEGINLHRVGSWRHRKDALEIVEVAFTRRSVVLIDAPS